MATERTVVRKPAPPERARVAPAQTIAAQKAAATVPAAAMLQRRLGNQGTAALIAPVAQPARQTAATPATEPAAAPAGSAPLASTATVRAAASTKPSVGAPPSAGTPGEASKAHEKGEGAAPAARSARQAIAPAIGAVSQRAAGARKHSPADVPVKSAQAAAISPRTEQIRDAAAATVAKLDEADAEKVRRDQFKSQLRKAIVDATPKPKSESEAEGLMKTGGAKASGALRGTLATERDTAAGPLKSAAGSEVDPSKQPAPPKTDLHNEPIGAPPAPVAAAPVVPAPLPPEQLDYSSDRAPTDRVMADNGVTKEQLQKGNDPAFGPTIEARSTAEKNEATVEARYRGSEEKVRDNALGAAQAALGHGLGSIHSARTTRIGKVVGQQVGTAAKAAAERQRVTDTITGIKNKTRADVELILKSMETDAADIFEAGLKRAEKAYEDTFEDAKGGVGTWLTTWGSDWEKLIEESLGKARAEYLHQVDDAIDQVATSVETKLKAAKQRVADGRREVENFVKGLNDNVKGFGEEALRNVLGDFDAMGAEIDQRRDGLIDKLAQQYKASYERMSAMEEKLREANKSLWQRVYDATVGLIKKIIAFKDMLLGLLAKAAAVIGDIIADPIGFLGNLVSSVMQGLKNFMANIGTHLKKGLLDWLFGALGGAGLQLPDTLDLKGIVSIVLQVLGLTYANFRARAVAIVGEPVVAALEKTAEIFKVIVSEGIAGLWRFIKEKVADLKSMVLDAIFDFIKEKVIVAGVTWVIGLLNPASAFFKACKAIYDIVMFFVNRGSQILALVNAIIDSIGAIAKGSLGTAIAWVESALAKAIPVAIGFLASLLGLGDISGTIRKTIDKAQTPVNKAIDWAINLAVKGVKAIGGLLSGATKNDQKATPDDPEKAARITVGLAAIDAEEKKLQKDGNVTPEAAASVASAVRKNYPVFATLVPIDGGDHWKYRYTASNSADYDSGNKKGLLVLEVRQVKVKKKPSTIKGWEEFEQASKEVARKEVLPSEFGRPVVWSPMGLTKTKPARPKETPVELLPEDIAAAMPTGDQPVQAFNTARLPAEGKKGQSVGSSNPDLLALRGDEIVPVEVTLRSQWSKENVDTGEAGGWLHKHSQSASVMLNLQPFLAQHPLVKVQLIFISDQPPDNIAKVALEHLANESYPGQIAAIKWLHF